MKYIVTSGCSFSDPTTTEHKTWPVQLEELYPNHKIYGLGCCGQGSDWISKSIIYKVNELLKSDINTSEILILCCWSGLDRRSILVNKEITSLHYRFKDWKMHKSNEMRKMKIGSWQDFDEEFAKLISREQNVYMSVENILRTQWFLTLHNLEYRFFTYRDIFTDVENEYPDISYLWDMIDWDKWWFHNEYGGMTEWINDNIKGGFDGEGGYSGHPISSSHKVFTEKVVSKWIK